MLRAFRNRRRLAKFFAWFFHGCQVLQHVPFLRGLCCDELTVLARKDEAPAVGFELNRVEKFFEEFGDGRQVRRAAAERLKEARKRGWLDEHLYLSKLVDDLDIS